MARKSDKKKTAKWVSYEKDEIQAIIEKMAKDGLSSAQIGMVLRDKYGIPDARQFGVKVNRVAEAVRPREVPDDMLELLKKAVVMKEHLTKNHSDAKARHAVETLESKVRSLGKYYIKKKRLPQNWSYSFDDAKLLVKSLEKPAEAAAA